MPCLRLTEKNYKAQAKPWTGLVTSYNIQSGSAVGLFYDIKHAYTHLLTYLLTFLRIHTGMIRQYTTCTYRLY